MSLSSLRGVIRSYGLLPPRDDFRQLLNAILPNGEGLVLVIRVYIDESGTDKQNPVVSTAGYIFSAAKATKFTRKWNKVLAKAGLDYFHTVDCLQGVGPYKRMTRDERDKLARSLIKLIRECAMRGVAVCLSEEEYNEKAPPGFRQQYGSYYTASVHMCMTGIAKWADEYGYNGRIAYIVEKGHPDWKEARRLLGAAAADPTNAERLRYDSLAFVPKGEMARPCEAADYFAWHVRKHFGLRQPERFYDDRILTHDDVRLDFGALQEGREGDYSLLKLTGPVLEGYFAMHGPPNT